MDICKDIILRALCHRLSLGGERYVNMDKSYLVRIDKEGIIINSYLTKWKSVTPSFIRCNFRQLSPIINNTRCTVVHYAPWLFTKLLEEGAACYTHVYREYPDVEIKEYILPDFYKFNIVKYIDQDDLFVIDTRDFIWSLRSWSIEDLSVMHLIWDESTESFCESSISHETVSYDAKAVSYKSIIRDYQWAVNELMSGG